MLERGCAVSHLRDGWSRLRINVIAMALKKSVSKIHFEFSCRWLNPFIHLPSITFDEVFSNDVNKHFECFLYGSGMFVSKVAKVSES